MPQNPTRQVHAVLGAGLKNELSEITKRRETNDSVLVERSFYTRQVYFEAPYLQVMYE